MFDCIGAFRAQKFYVEFHRLFRTNCSFLQMACVQMTKIEMDFNSKTLVDLARDVKHLFLVSKRIWNRL